MTPLTGKTRAACLLLIRYEQDWFTASKNVDELIHAAIADEKFSGKIKQNKTKRSLFVDVPIGKLVAA